MCAPPENGRREHKFEAAAGEQSFKLFSLPMFWGTFFAPAFYTPQVVWAGPLTTQAVLGEWLHMALHNSSNRIRSLREEIFHGISSLSC